jgi:hypothetical protein
MVIAIVHAMQVDLAPGKGSQGIQCLRSPFMMDGLRPVDRDFAEYNHIKRVAMEAYKWKVLPDQEINVVQCEHGGLFELHSFVLSHCPPSSCLGRMN